METHSTQGTHDSDSSDDDVVDEGDLCTCIMSLYYGKVVSYADKKEDDGEKKPKKNGFAKANRTRAK